MARSPEEYKYALIRILPRGPMWPSTDGDRPNWDALLDALAEEFGRFEVSEDTLSDECFPDSCTLDGGGLQQWERVLSLPAVCAPDSQTEDERRSAVLVRLAGQGAVTEAEIQAAADLLGAGITVDGRAGEVFQMGIGAMGDALCGDDWTTTVVVTYPAPQNDALECTLRHLGHIHLTWVFEVI